MTRWARALDTGQWHWTSSPQAFVRYINKGGTYLFLQIILPFIHLDQIKYLLSRPPCWTPFSACPRVVTGQLLALWKGWPPLICESVLVEYHCELVTTVTPYDEIYQVGAAIALFCIIFGSSLGVQGHAKFLVSIRWSHCFQTKTWPKLKHKAVRNHVCQPYQIALMRSTLHIEGGGRYLFAKLLNCRNSRSNPSLPPGHVLASLSVADKYTLYVLVFTGDHSHGQAGGDPEPEGEPNHKTGVKF